MTVQQDFLDIEELEELSIGKRVELHQALEDLLSSNIETRHQGMKRLCEMDAYRRSPLAAYFLVSRLIEQELALRRKILHSICEVIKGQGFHERSPTRVREYLHRTLRGIGLREIHALLELVSEDEGLLEQACILLNQCSTSGEILVNILNCCDYPIPIRMASCKVIGQIGFLDAREAIESLEKRLAGRTSGQLNMAFAPRAVEAAKELIPVLRVTLDALKEASI
jgi:hypothetical protein